MKGKFLHRMCYINHNYDRKISEKFNVPRNLKLNFHLGQLKCLKTCVKNLEFHGFPCKILHGRHQFPWNSMEISP